MANAARPVLKLFFSNHNLYGQVVQRGGGVVASASTLEKALKEIFQGRSRTDKKAAADVGAILASRAIAANVNQMHWDRRRGEKYHGKLAALLDSMKETGVQLK